MSHQTGIKSNNELLAFFSVSKSSNNIRGIKVRIEDEKLVLVDYDKIKKDCMSDYDRILTTYIEDRQPCYIFFRLDAIGDSSYNWLFIFWSPDDAPIKQKMLYASTKATIKKEFGLSFIIDEIFATNKCEILDFNMKDAYDKRIAPNVRNRILPIQVTTHLNSNTNDQLKRIKYFETSSKDIPLTNQHAQFYESQSAMKAAHSINPPSLIIFKNSQQQQLPTSLLHKHNVISVDTKQKSMHGLAFPFTGELTKYLNDFKGGKLNYLRMKIITEAEEIGFDHSSTNPDIQSLQKLIPISGPRYHLYRFHYIYDEQKYQDTIFLYSMPGQANCSIKDRMLYSSCKHKVIQFIMANFGIDIAKTFEIENGDEITQDFLINEIHPPDIQEKEKFSKPKGPASRGPRRMIKNL